MRCIGSPNSLLLLLAVLQTSSLDLVSASPLAGSSQQKVLAPGPQQQQQPGNPSPKPNPPQRRKLYGRFLHLTDMHPDPLYLRNSSTTKSHDCHRANGRAGYWGAVRSECDSPLTLTNATFEWIRDNLRDQIDFIVWTGDNIRHDSDPLNPRNESEVFALNKMMIDSMIDVFKKDTPDPRDPLNNLIIPVVPTLGNNDVYPHNIMLPGPSDITHNYLQVWRDFIPEQQHNIFKRGAYFWAEVIPGKLAVFSLNTIYFFSSNMAVDGCNFAGEPGYQQFTWLKVQLDLMRERGMKAMMMGHVPPARTANKQSWDDTCWSKFVIWMWHYRDVVVGNLWGHMNLDHFMLMDVNLAHQLQDNPVARSSSNVSTWEEMVHVQVAGPYLTELRKVLSMMPRPPAKISSTGKHKKKKTKTPQKKYLKKIGGKYGERYVLSIVGPSVLPNYYPSLRIIEYNITGLVDKQGYLLETPEAAPWPEYHFDTVNPPPDPNIPSPPPTGSAPGPAYSPQSLSFTGIVQYYSNITKFNGWVPKHDDKGDRDDEPGTVPPGGTNPDPPPGSDSDDVDEGSQKQQPPTPIYYELEYATKNDTVWPLKDMTVRSHVQLANAMRDRGIKGSCAEMGFCDDLDNDDDDDGDLDDDIEDNDIEDDSEYDLSDGSESNELDPNGVQKKRDKLWHSFVKRAFVGAVPDDEIDLIP